MIQDEFVQEVPAPLSHWYGKARLSEDNQELLARKKILRKLQTAPRWAFWAKNELKEAESKLAMLNTALESHGINQALKSLKELNEEGQAIRVEMFNTQQEYKRSQEPENCQRLRELAAVLRGNMAGVKADKQALLSRLKPHRPMIQERDKLADRIQEHYAAIFEEREEAIRTRDMDKESRLVAQRIIMALNQLGFYHKKTKRDMFGKVIEVMVACRFERIITTPDKIILKLDISRLGLLGGHVDNLPYGVYAQDLVSERVITHLNTTIELPISSPNMDGGTDWYKGVWFVVDRLGIADGLEPKIAYSSVMRHYPEKHRELIPVPLGVKAGRKINWVNLAKEPHVMINGTTGFGKSNAFQMLLASLVSKHSPDDIRLIIADMKDSGDFRDFMGLPHVLSFISELDKAESLIHSLWLEMKRRQALIRNISNDLNKYNQLVKEADKLPHIFFFFDEYPSIKINKKIAAQINLYASLIAMQGRSAGIHLVISGQQSYSEDFPRTLIANITAQFTARQNSVSGAIGTTGDRSTMRLKEIAGRFLFASSARRFQVQMPFILDSDIEAAAEQARRWPMPRPFALPKLDESEEEPIEAQQSPEDLILDKAFSQFEGALKASAIWKSLNGAVSMPKTTQIVNNIVSQETIEWEGKSYEAIKQKGNFYKLIEIESEAEIEPEIA